MNNGALSDGSDLRDLMRDVREIRAKVESRPGRTAITPQSFYEALRKVSPNLPEVPRGVLAEEHPDERPWPDNCGAWLGIAFECYQGAMDDAAAGHTESATFHEAEGAYALFQAGACLELGF